ncbi:MAG: hypothetical protein NT004_03930 [Bacteroidetes bacterium]|nr:hypothetical protein [Bacteroidota bacterium]
MDRKLFGQFIIISGSGKKVGKTWLATALIRAFHHSVPLIALKISPHKHDSLGNSKISYSSENFRIYQDIEPHHKNSGQYLQAGAGASFFMEAEDCHLDEAFTIFMNVCNPEKRPVICESGALGGKIKPAIMIFITSGGEGFAESKKRSERLADFVLPARIFSADEVALRIKWSGGQWYYEPLSVTEFKVQS